MERGVEINREEFEDIEPIGGFLNFKNHHAFLYIGIFYMKIAQ